MRRTLFAATSALALGLGALCVAPAAYAADASNKSDDLTARTEAAAKLVSVMHLDRQLDSLMPQVINVMLGSLIRGNTGHEDQIKQILTEEFGTAFGNQKAAFIANYRAVYAKNLTLEEMKAMTDFYASPVGQSVLEKMPKLNQDGMQGGVTIGRDAAQEALPRIIQRMQAIKLAVPQGV